MKIEELKNKTNKELEKMLAGLRESLREARFKVSQRQLKNVHGVGNAKKDIARVMTVIKINSNKGNKYDRAK